MGRNAKPVSLHLVGGNKSRKTKKELEERQAAEERLRPPADKVRPPTWLSKDAKKIFRRIVKDLEETDLLTNVDVHPLAVYCDAVVQHAAATRILEEEGLTSIGANGQKVQHPAVLVATKYAGLIAKYTSKFGFDPAARASLAMPAPKEDESPATPFDRMFADV